MCSLISPKRGSPQNHIRHKMIRIIKFRNKQSRTMHAHVRNHQDGMDSPIHDNFFPRGIDPWF